MEEGIITAAVALTQINITVAKLMFQLNEMEDDDELEEMVMGLTAL